MHIHADTVFVLTYRTQWLTVITVQTSMLIEGVVEIVKVETLGTDVLNHLKSKPVWKAAVEYVFIQKFLDPLIMTMPRLIDVLKQNKTQANLPHIAKEKYDAFVRALLVRLVSALLNRPLSCHNRHWASSLCQKLMSNS